jgi:hypothetical protein
MTDTPAKRVYAIRLARGDGWKVPESMEAFAEAMTAVGRKRRPELRYDSSKVSRIESGDRKVSIEDAEVLAAVDPLKRGAAWVAFGNAGDHSAVFVPPPELTEHRMLPDPDAPGATETAPDAGPRRGKAGGDR